VSEFNLSQLTIGRQSLFSRTVANLAETLSPLNEGRPLVTLDDLFIRTKERESVPFKPNAVQTRYLDELLPNWRNGDIRLHGLRELILKARQEGLSTLIAALMFCETVNTPYTQAAVIAHKADSTERLFQMIQRFYDGLPEDKRPRTKYASRREYYWPDIDSSFYVGTAGERDFGRSSTINLVHASEVGFWPDARRIVTSLMQAVPYSGSAFYESTANGVGDWFHAEWLLTEEGESTFTGRFFSWAQHHEYQRPIEDEDFKPTVEEEKLIKAHGLSNEQINWRRNKVKEIKEDFPQEYPLTPEEAFLSTGSPYFIHERLRELLVECKPALEEPKIPERYKLLRRLNKNQLEIYERPKKGQKYVLSADTAEGLDEDGNHDYDSADVLDAETFEQVAHLHGRWDTHDYGLLLAELATWYRLSLLGVERNNHGHAVINSILHSADYPRMTLSDPLSGVYMHKEYDEKKKMRIRKPGWPTTQKTKFFALDQLATWLEERSIKINCKHTIRECMTFNKLPGGKAGGAKGTHDDRVMSLAIACGMLVLRPRPVSRKTGWRGKSGGFV